MSDVKPDEGAWCCPCCGLINAIEGEFSRAGYCQGEVCVARRRAARLSVPLPEILWVLLTRVHAHA